MIQIESNQKLLQRDPLIKSVDLRSSVDGETKSITLSFFVPKKKELHHQVAGKKIDEELGIFISKNKNPILSHSTYCKDQSDSEVWELPKIDIFNLPEGVKVNKISHEKFPSIGTAPVNNRYIKCDAISDHKSCEWISIKSIVERFNSNQPISISVLHAALQVANENQVKIELPGVKIPHGTLGKRYEQIEQRKIKIDELKGWVSSVASNLDVSIVKTKNPENPFIAQDTRLDDNGNEYTFAKRRGNDSQDSICYTWHRGQLYMPIRLGIRPGLVYAYDDNACFHKEQFLSIGGVAGSLEKEDTTIQKVIARGLSEVEEELGIAPVSKGEFLGSFLTGETFTPEVSSAILVEVNPDIEADGHYDLDEIRDTRYMELDEIIDAFDKGILTDERLEISARLLKALTGYHNPFDAEYLNSKRIGFIGGTFDPFTNSHLKVIQGSLDSNFADTVVIIPNHQNPLKDHAPRLSTENRLDSIASVASGMNNVYVDTDEILDVKREVSYTYDTLCALRQKLPKDAELLMIIGTDLIGNFHRWYKFDEVIDMLDGFIVVPRDDFRTQDLEAYRSNISKKAYDMLLRGITSISVNKLSSTLVRNLLDKDKPVDNLVPERVYPYLKR